jgi:hypothetical protein
MKRYDDEYAESEQKIIGDYAYKYLNEIEECSVEKELLNNQMFMSIVKTVMFVFFVLAVCCVCSMCSYMSLKRKYERLENRHI